MNTGDAVKFVYVRGNTLPQVVDPATIYFIEGSKQVYVGSNLVASHTVVDSQLDAYSHNPLENSVIYQSLLLKGTMVVKTTAEWNSTPSAKSEKDVIYVYSDYKQTPTGYIPGFKLGDGMAYIVDLPFSAQDLYEHINNMDIHVTPEEKEFWNSKVRCFMSAVVDDQLIFTTN